MTMATAQYTPRTTAPSATPPTAAGAGLRDAAQIEDTTDTRGRLIAASQVNGTAVYNARGERLGTIEDVMIEKVSGQVVYAVLGFGGFLGIGNRHYPLPWSVLKYDVAQGGYLVHLDKAMLENAPSYEDASTVQWEDPTWGRRVHEYYHARPYWDRSTVPPAGVTSTERMSDIP
jgi:sporulation protein YlmC with PRC-barrel domain